MTHSDPKTRTHWVWRISSVLLLTLWALLAAAPFAQAAEPDRAASLPACCRTHGAHHCAGAAASQPAESPAFTTLELHEKCPCTPVSGSSVLSGAAGLADAAPFDLSASTAQATSCIPSAVKDQDSTGANPKRGPPASSPLR